MPKSIRKFLEILKRPLTRKQAIKELAEELKVDEEVIKRIVRRFKDGEFDEK